MNPADPSEQLIQAGWERVEQALLRASSEHHLIIHWFQTPENSETHSDAHWHNDERTVKFVRVVIPTLAEQLRATDLTVAVPWQVGAERATLVLIAATAGQAATLAARPLTRSALADAPPYWKLSPTAAEPPAVLAELVAQLVI